MAAKPTEEWRNSSLVTIDDGGLSSDQSTSYEEEVVTPPKEKARRIVEYEDPTYTPMVDQPSTRNSRTPVRPQADDEDRVSK